MRHYFSVLHTEGQIKEKKAVECIKKISNGLLAFFFHFICIVIEIAKKNSKNLANQFDREGNAFFVLRSSFFLYQ